MTVSELLKVYQAQALHGAARRACERATTAMKSGAPSEDDALIAVILSAASLEAFLNELLEVASSPPSKPEYLLAFVDLLSEMDEVRASIRSRFYTARFLLPGPNFRKGHQPYQDLDLIFAVRDHVLHLRPESLSRDGSGRQKLYKRLEARHLITHTAALASTLSEIQTVKVASWACNVVVDVVDFFKQGSLADTDSPDSVTHWLWIHNFERTTSEQS
jgi:hypothetical protein